MTVRFLSDHAAVPAARRSTRRSSISIRKTLRDVPEQRARWKRGVALIDGALGEAVGADLCRQILVAGDRSARRTSSSPTCARPIRTRSTPRRGWTRRPARRRWRSSPASIRASATRSKWIDYATLPVSRTDPLANDHGGRRDFQWRLQLKRFPQAGRSRAVVHDAADGERLLRPDAEPDHAARRRSCSRPSSTPTPIRRSTMRRPARPRSGTRWATASTIRAGSSTRRAACATGGRRRPAKHTRCRPTGWRRSSTSYEPIPGVHIKGQLTLGENLADLGGLETAYAAYRRYVARHGEPAVIERLHRRPALLPRLCAGLAGQAPRGRASARSCCRDPHSPDKYRVNGIVRNFDPWYQRLRREAGRRAVPAAGERVQRLGLNGRRVA